jgi:lipopolysaccharide export system protein LptA
VTADYSKITQGGDKAPGVAFLRGKVQITQGSIKATGAEATIYQHASAPKGSESSSSVQRVVLVGKQAHMEQQQDKGGLVSADADKIDYDADTSVAVLTGNVTVVQQGTGEMESSDTTSHKPVTMTFEPKTKAAPAKAKPDAAAAKKDDEAGKQP